MKENLLITGAREAGLPTEYQLYLARLPHYTPPNSGRAKLGAILFLAWARPVWKALDIITHSNTRSDGRVSESIVWLVRSVIFIIWFVHDWLFAPLFGRGDGLIETVRRTLSEPEKTPLLNEQSSATYSALK